MLTSHQQHSLKINNQDIIIQIKRSPKAKHIRLQYLVLSH